MYEINRSTYAILNVNYISINLEKMIKYIYYRLEKYVHKVTYKRIFFAALFVIINLKSYDFHLDKDVLDMT